MREPALLRKLQFTDRITVSVTKEDRALMQRLKARGIDAPEEIRRALRERLTAIDAGLVEPAEAG